MEKNFPALIIQYKKRRRTRRQTNTVYLKVNTHLFCYLWKSKIDLKTLHEGHNSEKEKKKKKLPTMDDESLPVAAVKMQYKQA